MEKSEKICVVCGKDYTNEDFLGMKENYCFSCSFWQEQLELDNGFRKNPENKKVVIVVDGFHYVADIDENNKKDFFKGFGGCDHFVEFLDGKVQSFNNVWFQGKIPENFRDKMPDNARFLSLEEYQAHMCKTPAYLRKDNGGTF